MSIPNIDDPNYVKPVYDPDPSLKKVELPEWLCFNPFHQETMDWVEANQLWIMCNIPDPRTGRLGIVK